MTDEERLREVATRSVNFLNPTKAAHYGLEFTLSDTHTLARFALAVLDWKPIHSSYQTPKHAGLAAAFRESSDKEAR